MKNLIVLLLLGLTTDSQAIRVNQLLRKDVEETEAGLEDEKFNEKDGVPPILQKIYKDVKEIKDVLEPSDDESEEEEKAKPALLQKKPKKKKKMVVIEMPAN